MTIGPVDVVVVKFPGNKFSGELLPLLRGLVANGTIRIIDLLFVGKTAEGDVVLFEIAGVDETLEAAFVELDIVVGAGLLDEDDAAIVGEALEPNSSAVLLAWENAWAAPFVEALERADAQVIDQVRIPREVVLASLAAAGIEA